MSQWFLWMILSSLLGNPVLAAVLLVVGYWVVDRFTLGILPDPVRRLRRWMRAGRLRRELEHNPHDRKARFDLADLLVGRKQYRAAVELLRPNLEAGDDDPPTLFLMGVACLGAGFTEQGEKLLDHVEQAEPTFRHGAVDLERGRWRLASKNSQSHKAAKEALERFIAVRQGTVEGRVLLAQAMEACGDDASGALMRAEAWSEYRTAPRFQRRLERFWAWRAKPSRPLAYAALALVAAFFVVRYVAPGLAESVGSMRVGRSQGYHRGYGYAPPESE